MSDQSIEWSVTDTRTLHPFLVWTDQKYLSTSIRPRGWAPVRPAGHSSLIDWTKNINPDALFHLFWSWGGPTQDHLPHLMPAGVTGAPILSFPVDTARTITISVCHKPSLTVGRGHCHCRRSLSTIVPTQSLRQWALASHPLPGSSWLGWATCCSLPDCFVLSLINKMSFLKHIALNKDLEI